MAKPVIARLSANQYSVKYILLTIIFLSVFIDILSLTDNSDQRIFTLLLLYIGTIVYFKIKSNLTFIFTLILLGIMYIEFLISGAAFRTEKAAVWLYLFLAIGIFQKWKE